MSKLDAIRQKMSFKLIRQDFIGEIDDKVTLDFQNTRVAVSGAFFVALASFIGACFICPLSSIFWVALVLTILLPLTYLIFQCLFKEKEGKASQIICAFYMFTAVCILWYKTGNEYGVGILWSAFSIVYFSILFRNTIKVIYNSVMVLETIVMSYLTVNGIWVDVTIDSVTIRNISVFSFLCIAAYISTVIGAQKNLASKQRAISYQLQEDITAFNEELIAMNDELKSVANQLDDSLHKQKIFTAAMNHELRSPINGVCACLNLLDSMDNLDEQQRSILRAGISSSNALLQIVNDLLDYAKIEQGKFEIIPDNFNLREMLDDSLEIFSNLIREKNMELIRTIDDDMVCGIYADGNRIRQILINLVSNAIKYTPKGFVELKMRVEYEDVNNGNLHFEVIDSGEGISEETKAALFEPFQRINEKEHKKIQGTGLGLYIVSNLVHQMEGTIQVESELGKGSNFTVEIPVKIVDENLVYRTANVQKKDEIATVDKDFTNMRFLCVDDNSVNLIMMKKQMEKYVGAATDICKSGEEALQKVKNNTYDLMFFDHLMPNMDGIELFHKVREAGIKTPVVMMTGNVGQEYSEMYVAEGVDGYLTKPVRFQEVKDLIVKLTNN